MRSGLDWQGVRLGDLRLFLLGLLDHMRSQGAVVTPVTRMFVQREARWIAVLKGFGGGRNSLPNYCARVAEAGVSGECLASRVRNLLLRILGLLVRFLV